MSSFSPDISGFVRAGTETVGFRTSLDQFESDADALLEKLGITSDVRSAICASITQHRKETGTTGFRYESGDGHERVVVYSSFSIPELDAGKPTAAEYLQRRQQQEIQEQARSAATYNTLIGSGANEQRVSV